MRFSILSFSSLPALIAAPVSVLAEPPQVVADIAPLHALLSQVMEGVGVPDLLLDQNANPHAAQLKPSQARMLTEADLVFWVGPELSPWLERILEAQDGDHIAMMEHPATHLRDFDGAGTDHDHEAHEGHGEEEHDDHDEDGHDDLGEEGHDDHGEEGHDGHNHTGVDPHVWLATENARAWLGVFADMLSERDPDNAEIYRSNTEAAFAKVDALEHRIEDRLAAHQGAEIVTFHAAFGYFADEFGIEIAGSVRPGDAAAPSAAAVAELKDLVADHGIECAFAEPGFDPGLLDAIAGGTGLRIGTLDPTGVLQPVGPNHYSATLDAIAVGIAECLESE
ncbi:MAG TPA: hypothetical protein DIU07_04985 [Rhodobacteraceae bacterium]|nr:hypothetical protein [Paracoccaceae bacterium]